MRGIKNPNKENAIELMSYGVPFSVVSRILKVPITTISEWGKKLPSNAIKSKFNKKNTQISLIDHINTSVLKVIDIFDDYLIYDITDEEWESLNQQLFSLINNLCLHDK